MDAAASPWWTSTTHAYHHYGSDPIKLDVVRDPKAWAQQTSHRTLIFFHIGGLVCGNRSFMFPGYEIELLLRKGWQVVTADYHLLPQGSVADMIADAKHLEEWILRDGKSHDIDPNQVALAGASAGSFVAVLALSTWKQLRIRAFLTFFGMLDIVDPWYSTPKGENADLGGFSTSYFQSENVQHLLDPHAPAIWDDQSEVTDMSSRGALFLWLLKEGKVASMVQDSLKKAVGTNSLLDLITASFPPTVAAHGIADTLIPINDSRKLIQTLEKRGVRAQLVEVEGANHGMFPGESFAAELNRTSELFELMFQENSS